MSHPNPSEEDLAPPDRDPRYVLMSNTSDGALDNHPESTEGGPSNQSFNSHLTPFPHSANAGYQAMSGMPADPGARLLNPNPAYSFEAYPHNPYGFQPSNLPSSPDFSGGNAGLYPHGRIPPTSTFHDDLDGPPASMHYLNEAMLNGYLLPGEQGGYIYRFDLPQLPPSMIVSDPYGSPASIGTWNNPSVAAPTQVISTPQPPIAPPIDYTQSTPSTQVLSNALLQAFDRLQANRRSPYEISAIKNSLSRGVSNERNLQFCIDAFHSVLAHRIIPATQTLAIITDLNTEDGSVYDSHRVLVTRNPYPDTPGASPSLLRRAKFPQRSASVLAFVNCTECSLMHFRLEEIRPGVAAVMSWDGMPISADRHASVCEALRKYVSNEVEMEFWGTGGRAAGEAAVAQDGNPSAND